MVHPGDGHQPPPVLLEHLLLLYGQNSAVRSLRWSVTICRPEGFNSFMVFSQVKCWAGVIQVYLGIIWTTFDLNLSLINTHVKQLTKFKGLWGISYLTAEKNIG